MSDEITAMPVDEKAWEKEITAGIPKLLANMSSGNIRLIDGHRPWISQRDQAVNLVDVALGTYQVHVSTFTLDQLQRLTDHLLRQLTHLIDDMKGYSGFRENVDHSVFGNMSVEDKEKIGFSYSRFNRSNDVLYDTGFNVRALAEKKTYGKSRDDVIVEQILVPATRGLSPKPFVHGKFTRSLKDGETWVIIETCWMNTEEASRFITDWQGFIRFLNNLEAWFAETDRYYRLMLRKMSDHSVHALSANLIHGAVDVP